MALPCPCGDGLNLPKPMALMDYEDLDYDYDEDYDDYSWEPDPWDEDDDWFPMGCDLPGCIMPAGHFRSECYTARDAEEYYAEAEGRAMPWRLREPFYTMGLAYRAIKYRSETAKHELHFHWHCNVLPALRPRLIDRLWPRKCMECGRRWRACDGCLPFWLFPPQPSLQQKPRKSL